jgi:isoquinoline 1-oxidoreductase beta subunit
VPAQIQSGIIFDATAALYGEMRMNEAPAIEVHIVKSSEPPGGKGETGTAATVPAVASAIFEQPARLRIT